MSVSGWRWVYYFNAIFFGISGLLILILYKPPPTFLRRENSIMEEVRSVDYTGILLLLLGAVGIVTALTWGGNAYDWNDAHVIAMLVVGIALLIGFCLYGTVDIYMIMGWANWIAESYGRKDGLIDHRFLQSRNFLLILSVAFVDGMLLYGVNAFFPIEASAIFTNDPVVINSYLVRLPKSTNTTLTQALRLIIALVTTQSLCPHRLRNVGVYIGENQPLPNHPDSVCLPRSHILWSTGSSNTLASCDVPRIHRFHWSRRGGHDCDPRRDSYLLCPIVPAVSFYFLSSSPSPFQVFEKRLLLILTKLIVEPPVQSSHLQGL